MKNKHDVGLLLRQSGLASDVEYVPRRGCFKELRSVLLANDLADFVSRCRLVSITHHRVSGNIDQVAID